MSGTVCWLLAVATTAAAPLGEPPRQTLSPCHAARLVAEVTDPDEWPEDDTKRAVVICDQVIASSDAAPVRAVAYQMKGRALAKAGRTADALDAFRQSARSPLADPAFVYPVALLDGTFDRMSSADKAGLLLRLARQTHSHPYAAELYGCAAVSLMQSGDLDGASGLAKDQLATHPTGQKLAACLGGIHVLRGRPADGDRVVDQFLRLAPNKGSLAEMFDLRANACMRLGRFGAANGSCLRAISLRPDPTPSGGAALLFCRVASTCLDQGRPANACLAAKRVLSVRPGEALPWLLLARATAARNDNPSALSFVEAAARLGPLDEAGQALHRRLVAACGQAGVVAAHMIVPTDAELLDAVLECDRVEDFFDPDPKTLLAQCERALAGLPAQDADRRARVLMLQAAAAGRLLQVDAMTTAFRQAVVAGCRDAEAVLCVEEAERPLPGGPAERLSRYADLLDRVRPDKSVAGLYGEMAKLAELTGRADQADEYIKLGREADSKNGWFLSNVCRVLTDRGRTAEAVELVDAFVEEQPGSRHVPRMWCRKAEAHLAAGRPREALGAALASNKLCRYPGDGPCRVDNGVTLAKAYRAVGKPASALYAATRSAELYEGRADTHLVKSLALMDLDEPSEAVDSSSRAAALAPLAVSAHRLHGDALAASGRGGAALAAYQRALALDQSDERALFGVAVLRATSRDGKVFDAAEALRLSQRGLNRPGRAISVSSWQRVVAASHWAAGDRKMASQHFANAQKLAAERNGNAGANSPVAASREALVSKRISESMAASQPGSPLSLSAFTLGEE